MANTTNFGWETPDDTDLVKDGASAMRTLGSAIDTSMGDLKGGTTGQILTKNSNTDMDFVWNSNSGIAATIVDAKGDLIAATAADTVARLAVGTNGQILTADSTASTGLKWSTASTPTTSYTLLNAGGTALTGATTITVSSLSGYNEIYVYVTGASATGDADYTLRLNSDTGSNYIKNGFWLGWGASNAVTGNGSQSAAATSFALGQTSDASGTVGAGIRISAANSTGIKPVIMWGGGLSTGGETWTNIGHYAGTSVISSVSIISNNGNFDAGTIYVYGA